MGQLWRLLCSHSLALWLLALLALATLAGGTLPQASRLTAQQSVGWQTEWSTSASLLDSVGLSDIFGSWWYLGLCIVLLINMTAGIAVAVRRRADFVRGALAPRYQAQGEGVYRGDLPPCIKVPPVSGGSGHVLRGGLGLAGVPLFHLGIGLIVVAGIWHANIGFTDVIELAEGEIFDGQVSKLSRGEALPRAFPARVRMERAQVKILDKRFLGELQAYVSYQLNEGEVERAIIQPNAPLRLGDYDLFANNKFGYSAVFDRYLPDGQRRLLYINFPIERSDWDKAWAVKRDRSLRFEDVPLYFSMTLSGAADPVFGLQVTDRESAQVYKGELRPGQVADLGAYQLRFKGVVPWLGFNLSVTKAVPYVFLGFVLTLVGYLIHLLLRPRRVEFCQHENGWEVRAWVMGGDSAFERQWGAWRSGLGQGSML